MTANVELRGVTKDFGKVRAVDNVDVHIQAGEFFTFLGPSGSGKTSILRMIAGFTSPKKGQVLIGDQDMRGIGVDKRPTTMIFQSLALFPLMPVWENVAFGLEVKGAEKAERRAKAEELLQLVDLPGVADKHVRQLSGGQRQRVAIARALAVEPSVILLDEPLAELDLKLRQHMRAELRTIQKRSKVTFIYSTHDQGEALAISDRVAVMNHGKIQQIDVPKKIYSDPANGFVASFVGENNIFAGSLFAIDGARGKFRSAGAEFDVRVGQSILKNSKCNLYVRREHIEFSAKPKASQNAIKVMVEDVSFEGNFATVHLRDGEGKKLVAEMHSDAAQPPTAGTSIYVTFEADKALVLLDSGTVTQ